VIAGPYTRKSFKELNGLIKDPQINRSITWTGPLFDKLKWDTYISAEIFCLPSHQENFGISVAEAMSCKKPLIITNKVNIWKTIRKDSVGFISNDSFPSFYLSFKKYLKLDKIEYKEYSKNSYNCFIKNFHMKPIAEKFVNYLKDEFKNYSI
jgi:glycosyltransferase involved in cell wall biosynthesis